MRTSIMAEREILPPDQQEPIQWRDWARTVEESNGQARQGRRLPPRPGTVRGATASVLQLAAGPTLRPGAVLPTPDQNQGEDREQGDDIPEQTVSAAVAMSAAPAQGAPSQAAAAEETTALHRGSGQEIGDRLRTSARTARQEPMGALERRPGPGRGLHIAGEVCLRRRAERPAPGLPEGDALRAEGVHDMGGLQVDQGRGAGHRS
ncbi:hypothetical protein chiPu_0013766 [Chiloscyllium punctatum]|uniref:Uncharacterized protein n=1 Tax=Chiloscyllium punctatum TaxID=137246 RepID=A0A401SY20_CHIPU|nr:hypothetical protein [Chiloscyllium punctatum]